MRKTFFFLFILFSVGGNAQVWQQKFYMASQKVNAIARQGNTIYIGGDFDYVGQNEGVYTVFDSAVGTVNSSFPKIYFYTRMVEDGVGGWYVIGATNLEIGGQVRNRLAHIYANGYLSTWNPNPNGNITDLKVNGGKVYLSGTFDTVGGQRRKYIAALDTATGAATSWNPNIDQQIKTLAVTNNTVYVAGPFTFIAGQVRGVLAAFDATTGQITSWDPSGGTVFSSSNPDVKKMEAYNNAVYVGGGFTSIGGQSRSGFAAINATTGSITSWNPGTTASDWVIKNNVMYVTGAFSSIGGQSRPGLAALDLTTGLATPWAPADVFGFGAIAYTSLLAVSGNTVYVAKTGGAGALANGKYVYAINATTAATISWSPIFRYLGYPDYGGINSALAAGGGNVFTLGAYHGVNGETRNRLAALDANTGALTSWNPAIIGTVSKFLISGNTLYVIGSFTSIGNQARKNVAAFDLTTGLVTSWNPNPNNTVTDIAISNGTLYLSGAFTNVGGQIRNYLAAIDSVTGLATSWAPVVNATNNVLNKAGNKLYVGGSFSTIAGQARNTLASFDLATGNLTSWNPNPAISPYQSYIYQLASNSNTLFVYGYFNSISGQARNNFAAFNITSDTITAWTPNIVLPYYYNINVLAANDTVVYIGGGYSTSSYNGIALFTPVSATSGAIRSWNYPLNGSIQLTSLATFAATAVHAIALSGNNIYVGGIFTKAGNYSSPCLAVFGDAPNTPLPLHAIALGVQEKSNSAMLNWQVDEEDNIAKYEVEKSSDGRSFVSIGTAVTNGTHQYQLTDMAPFTTNFYRIKAVTKSGTFIYSKIVKLNIQGKGEITIYPNPVVNNELQLQLNNVKSGKYQMVIYNLKGQKLIQKVYVHQGGSQTIAEDVSKVATGINVITLTNESGKVLYKERWVKM